MQPINPHDMINLLIVLMIGFIVLDIFWGGDR
jgi:hypothetical protein